MNAKFRKAAFIYRCIHNWSIDSQMYITRELTLSGSARFQIFGKTWPTRDFRKLHTLTGEVEQLDLTWTLKGERCFLKFLNFHNATLYYKISENRSNDLCRPTGTPMITSELKGEVTGLCSGPRPKSISRRDFLAEHRIYFRFVFELWILMSQCFASLSFNSYESMLRFTEGILFEKHQGALELPFFDMAARDWAEFKFTDIRYDVTMIEW